MCTKGVLTFCFTGDMIKMAKVEGSRNAPFLYAIRRCLSNPFTPPVYIEGRNGRYQESQRNRADIPDVRS